MVRTINTDNPGLEDFEASVGSMLYVVGHSGIPLCDWQLMVCEPSKLDSIQYANRAITSLMPKHMAQEVTKYLDDTLNIKPSNSEFYDQNIMIMYTNSKYSGQGKAGLQRWYVNWHAYTSLIDDTVKRVVRELLEASSTNSPNRLYRGEPANFPKVSSTLYRKYDIDDSGFLQKALANHLLHARQYERIEDDFELQSLIQHFGGRTNLIDFSSSIWVALFFATDSGLSKSILRWPSLNEANPPTGDGRILVFDPSKNSRYEYFRDADQVSVVAQGRVRNQKSVFVSPTAGYLGLSEFTSIVRVPNEIKGNLRLYLKNIHGIRPESIFPDVHGYIREHDEYFSYHLLLSAGLALDKLGEFERALGYFDLAGLVDSRPFFYAQALCNKAATFMHMRKEKEALEYANETIRLLRQAGYRPQRKNGSMGTAYLVKAIISHDAGLLDQSRLELENAILYFDEDEVNRQIAENLLNVLEGVGVRS